MNVGFTVIKNKKTNLYLIFDRYQLFVFIVFMINYFFNKNVEIILKQNFDILTPTHKKTYYYNFSI